MTDYGIQHNGGPADAQKDPDDTIRLAFEWAQRLEGEEIDTVDYLLPDGLAEVDTEGDGSVRAALLSGGDCGRIYRVTCRITTDGGRQLDWTKRVLVRER